MMNVLLDKFFLEEFYLLDAKKYHFQLVNNRNTIIDWPTYADYLPYKKFRLCFSTFFFTINNNNKKKYYHSRLLKHPYKSNS